MSDVFDPYWEWLRIPPGQRPPSHYELLGVAIFEPDEALIRDQHRRRFTLVRSREGGHYTEFATRLLEEISHACNCLTDPDQRRSYDRTLGGPPPASLSDAPPVQVAPSPVERPSPIPLPGRAPVPLTSQLVAAELVDESQPQARWLVPLAVAALVLALVSTLGGVAAWIAWSGDTADDVAAVEPPPVSLPSDRPPAALPPVGTAVNWSGTLLEVAGYQDDLATLHFLVEAADSDAPCSRFEAYTDQPGFDREVADFTTAADSPQPPTLVRVTGVIAAPDQAAHRLGDRDRDPLLLLESLERLSGSSEEPGPVAQPGWQRIEASFGLLSTDRELLSLLRRQGSEVYFAATWQGQEAPNALGEPVALVSIFGVALQKNVRLVLPEEFQPLAAQVAPGEIVTVEAIVRDPAGTPQLHPVTMNRDGPAVGGPPGGPPAGALANGPPAGGFSGLNPPVAVSPEPPVDTGDPPADFNASQQQLDELNRDPSANRGQQVQVAAYFERYESANPGLSTSAIYLFVAFRQQEFSSRHFVARTTPEALDFLNALAPRDPIEFLASLTGDYGQVELAWIQRWQQPETRVPFRFTPLPAASPRQIAAHSGAVYALTWAPDASWLATAGADQALYIWDPVAGVLHPNRAGQPTTCFGLRASPTGNHLLVYDGTSAHVTDARSGAPLLTTSGYNLFTSAAFNPRGDRLALAINGQVHFYRAPEFKELIPLTQSAAQLGGVSFVAWHRDGRRIALAGYRQSYTIDLFRLSTNGARLVRQREIQADQPVTNLEWCGDTLAITLYDRLVLTPTSGQEINIPLPNWSTRRTNVSSDGQSIVLDAAQPSQDANTLTLFSVANGQEQASFTADALGVSDVAQFRWAPDSRRLATLDSQGTVVLYDTRLGRPTLRLLGPGAAICLAFSPDGAQLAIGYNTGALQIWDIPQADD